MRAAGAAGSVPASVHGTYVGASASRMPCDYHDHLAEWPYAAVQSLADLYSTRPLSNSESSRKCDP
jgi:hypothetical protein